VPWALNDGCFQGGNYPGDAMQWTAIWTTPATARPFSTDAGVTLPAFASTRTMETEAGPNTPAGTTADRDAGFHTATHFEKRNAASVHTATNSNNRTTNNKVSAWSPRGAGLYLGAHDPIGRLKGVYATPGSSASISLLHFNDNFQAAVEMQPGVWTVPYQIAVVAFEGDWYVPLSLCLCFCMWHSRCASSLFVDGIAMDHTLQSLTINSYHPSNHYNRYDAASIYREWVLPNSEWTKAGTIAERDDLPPWLAESTLWVASENGNGVQAGGQDYSTVVTMATELAKRFGTDLTMHWYCWTTSGCAGTVRVFRHGFALEEAIGSHTHSREANMHVPCIFD
jgi:hypothetical protein